MNVKKTKSVLAAALLAELASNDSWPQVPSITNNENRRRGGFYPIPDRASLPVKPSGTARTEICLKPEPSLRARTPGQYGACYFSSSGKTPSKSTAPSLRSGQS
jgi:hypothetical protein